MKRGDNENSFKFEFLIFILFIILISQTINASWWGESWAYRQAINVSVTSDDLINYQVKIVVNLTDEYEAGKLNSTCKDIRFINSTDDPIDFWIDECNVTGANSTFWVEVPFLQNNTNTTIYMYYGNLGTTSVSNGANTFPFFDDFTQRSGWQMVVIDNDIEKSLYPEVVDIDRDGNPDIVVAWGEGLYQGIYWYEAPDDPTNESWEKHVVDNNTLSGMIDPHAIKVIDVDLDGYEDILGGSHHSNESAWYKRTTVDGKSAWTKYIIDSKTLFTSHEYVHNIDAGDVDGGGDIEVVLVSEVPGEVYLYKQNFSATPTGTWNRTVIDATLTGAFRVHLDDIDDDSDLDIIATGYLDQHYYWYENPSWTRHQINEVALQDARSGEPFDVDQDGDLDLVAVDTDHLHLVTGKAIWYEQNSSNPTGYWTKHVVDDPLNTPFDMAAADIDGNGVTDLIVTEFLYPSSSADGNVWWYSADDPTGTWSKHYVGASVGPRNLYVYDLDEDGDQDIIIADDGPLGITGKLVWFVNDGSPKKTYDTNYVAGINTTLWNNTNASGAFAAWNGLLANEEGLGEEYLESFFTFSYPNILHFEFRSNNSNISSVSHGGGLTLNSTSYIEYVDNHTEDIISYNNQNISPTGGWAEQSWKEVDIYMINSTTTQVITDLGVDETLNISIENQKIRLGRAWSSTNNLTIDYDYDKVYIRNYTTTEPASFISSEENEPIPPSVLLFSCSPNIVRVGEVVTCSCIGTDNVDTNPTVSYTTNPSTASVGTHTTTCTVTDSFGNSGSASTSYLVLTASVGTPSTPSTPTTPTEPSVPTTPPIETDVPEVTEDVPIEITIDNPNVDVTSLTIATTEGVQNEKVIVRGASSPSKEEVLVAICLGGGQGEVYTAFTINLEKTSNDIISNATIGFKVNKTWFLQNNGTLEDLYLVRQDPKTDKWGSLPTYFDNEDNNFLYFKAQTPGFSLFAVFFSLCDCNPNAKRCKNDEVQLCVGNSTWLVTERCEVGCANGECISQSVVSEVTTFLKSNPVFVFTWIGGVILIVLALIWRKFRKEKKQKKRKKKVNKKKKSRKKHKKG